MRTTQQTLFRYCAIAVSAVVVANGCVFPRDSLPIPFSPGRIVPAQYCSGDTLTASYDFLTEAPDGMCTPRTGVPNDCTDAAPNVSMTSTPALFPSTPERLYRKSVDFAASGDRVDVLFEYRTPTVFIPVATFVRNVRDHTVSATRITAPVPNTIPHGGTCGGLVASYFPVEVPRLPRYSPNVGLLQVVNVNSFPVRYTISGTTPGDVFERTLMPGERIDTSMPGVPASIRGAQMVQAVPLVPQMCAPGGGAVDPPPSPPPLNTQVITGCP